MRSPRLVAVYLRCVSVYDGNIVLMLMLIKSIYDK